MTPPPGVQPEAVTGTIQKLDPTVAMQIAAGEVVTRPSSVAKELLENAIDAGAQRIRVEMDGGGVERLAIIDDGHGMSREDAVACIERHATSKLRVVDELMSLVTFGFRGEALPSIASVSRLRIQTRMASADEGTEVRIEGGAEPDVRPCGCAVGTTVEVTDLFFNVPARRKFLRAASTEGAHVTDVLKAVALAHPNVQIELHRSGRRALRYLPTDDRGQRTRAVLDGYPLHDVSGRRGNIEVEAYLSPPDRSRSGTGGLHLFVLGRPVRDRALSRAVAQAYAGALTPGRYPVGAVFITVPTAEVDINVHPQKSEVRFAHERDVVDAVFQVVGDAIAPRFVGKRSPSELDADRRASKPQRALDWQQERKEELKPEDTTWTAPQKTAPPNVAPPSESPPKPEPQQPRLSFEAAPSQAVPPAAPEPTPAPAPPAPPAPTQPKPQAQPAPPKPQVQPKPQPQPQAPSAQAGHRWLGTEQGIWVVVGHGELRLIPRKAAVTRWFTERARRQLDASKALLTRSLPPLALRRSPALCQSIAKPATLAAAKALGLIVTRSGEATLTVMGLPALLHGLAPEPLADVILQEALRSAAPSLEKLATHAGQAALRDERFDEQVVRDLEELGLLDELTERRVPLRS